MKWTKPKKSETGSRSTPQTIRISNACLYHSQECGSDTELELSPKSREITNSHIKTCLVLYL